MRTCVAAQRHRLDGIGPNHLVCASTALGLDSRSQFSLSGAWILAWILAWISAQISTVGCVDFGVDFGVDFWKMDFGVDFGIRLGGGI